MRSSKSRSRGKGNRSRSPSNNINRVFDSSGPEGKVRGTPQQIIDKYSQLSRDASLGNDRVAAENFQQHAEHYARLLSEAQRDADAKRQQNQGNQNNQQNGNKNQGQSGPQGQDDQGQQGGQQGGKPDRQDRDAQRRREKQNRPDGGDTQEGFSDPGSAPQPDVVVPEDGGLAETPDEKPKKQRAPRKPKSTKAPKADTANDPAPSRDTGDGTTEAAE